MFQLKVEKKLKNVLIDVLNPNMDTISTLWEIAHLLDKQPNPQEEGNDKKEGTRDQKKHYPG